MDSINISRTNTESAVSEIINKVQREVIDAGTMSGNQIINTIENSAGDFADSLKEEMEREIKIIKEAGELLIAMADYIRSAATAFEEADHAYNTSKLQ